MTSRYWTIDESYTIRDEMRSDNIGLRESTVIMYVYTSTQLNLTVFYMTDYYKEKNKLWRQRMIYFIEYQPFCF